MSLYLFNGLSSFSPLLLSFRELSKDSFQQLHFLSRWHHTTPWFLWQVINFHSYRAIWPILQCFYLDQCIHQSLGHANEWLIHQPSPSLSFLSVNCFSLFSHFHWSLSGLNMTRFYKLVEPRQTFSSFQFLMKTFHLLSYLISMTMFTCPWCDFPICAYLVCCDRMTYFCKL